MLTDLWTFKDKDIAPTMMLTDGGPVWVRRIVFFCGFPVYRFHYVRNPT
jgi:hypothetical protein